MAKRFLRRPYTFAQDTANYAAPTKAWDGQPKIVVPSDSQLNAGFTPNTGVDPTIANCLESDKADAISVAAHLALRSWTANPFVATLGNEVADFLVPVSPEGTAAQLGSRSVQAKLIASLGVVTANGHAQMKIFGNDPGILSGSDTGFPALACASSDTGGAGTSGSAIFGCEVGSSTCHYYSISSGAWFSFTPGISGQATAMFVTPNDGHYLVSDRGGRVRQAVSLTGPWADAVYGSGGDGIVTFTAGNGVIVAINWVTFGTSSNDRKAVYSSDDGVSWSTGHTFTNTPCSLTFNEAYGLFVVVTGSGQVWTSADGATWTLNKTSSVLATGIAPGAGQLASIGYAIVHLINRQTSTQKLRGVAYSFDLGATWNEWYFAEYTNGVDLKWLTHIDGALWATNGQTLWRSGRLSTPNTQYTGS